MNVSQISLNGLLFFTKSPKSDSTEDFEEANQRGHNLIRQTRKRGQYFDQPNHREQKYITDEVD